MQIEPLTLRPDPARTPLWAALSVILIVLGVWLVGDANGEAGTGPLLWTAFGLMVAVAAYFLLQFVVPSWFEVHVEEQGIRAQTLWQRLEVPWDHVESAGIRSIAGEPWLRLRVIDEVADGWVVRTVGVMLPLGADVVALRMALARARAVGRVEATASPAGSGPA